MTQKTWSLEETEELIALIKKGLDILEIVSLFSNVFERSTDSVKSKIYAIVDTMPGQWEIIKKRRKEFKLQTQINELRSEKPIVTEEVNTEEASKETLDVSKKGLPKSEIVSMVKKPDDTKFPMYGWKKSTGLTVMFLSLTNGIVINAGTSTSKLGLVSNNWTDCTNKQYWELLDEVTIIYHS